ncbi:hypothetical protein Tco_0759713 [Tanacetum coccineum]
MANTILVLALLLSPLTFPSLLDSPPFPLFSPLFLKDQFLTASLVNTLAFRMAFWIVGGSVATTILRIWTSSTPSFAPLPRPPPRPVLPPHLPVYPPVLLPSGAIAHLTALRVVIVGDIICTRKDIGKNW